MSLFGGVLQAFGVGAPNKYNAVATPDYKTDPNFDATQAYLKTYGENMMSGNMPDWYKQIGEVAPESLTGGLVTGATNDVVKRALESQAATTGRSGTVGADTMSAIGNMSAGLRYQDWLRAMSGRQDLLNTGINMEQGVRQNAMTNQNAMNSFDQWKWAGDVNQNIDAFNAANARKAYVGGGALRAADSAESTAAAILNQFGMQTGDMGKPTTSTQTAMMSNNPYQSGYSYAPQNNSPMLASQGNAKTGGSGAGGFGGFLQMLMSMMGGV